MIFACVGSAHAQVIISTQFAPAGYGAGYQITAAQTAGFTPAAQWNVLQGQGGSSSLSNLKDSSGAVSTTDLVYTSDSASIQLAQQGGAPSTPNEKLFGGFLISGNSFPIIPVTLTLSQINFATYDLIVYTSSSQANRNGSISLNGGTPVTFKAIQSAADPDPHDFTLITGSNSLGNYIQFSNLTGTTQSVSVAAALQFGFVGVSGFQIVSVPEPSACILIAISISVIFTRRRCLGCSL